MKENLQKPVGESTTFHRPRIFETVPLTSAHPLDLLALTDILRNKFMTLRKTLQEVEVDTGDDSLLINHTFLTKETDGNSFLISHDNLSEQEGSRLLDEINKKKEITFSGIVTFGRKNGQSVFSVATYCRVPLNKPIAELPENISELRDHINHDKDIEVGYRYYSYTDGQLTETKRKIDVVRADEIASLYASGQTPEVLRLAQESGEFDALTAPLIEESITKYPFNNFSFLLSASAQSNTDLLANYEQLFRNYKDFFSRYGGDCHFFTLDVAEKLRKQNLSPQIVTYPTLQPAQVGDLHSAIFVTDSRKNMYSIDPGDPWPFAVPMSTIPLLPFSFKKYKIWFDDYSGGGNTPDYFTLRNTGELHRWRVKDKLSPEQFRENIAAMFAASHNKRTKGVIAFPDRTGEMRVVCVVDLASKSVMIKTRDKEFPSMSVEDFLNSGFSKEISEICSTQDIDFAFIERPLRELII